MVCYGFLVPEWSETIINPGIGMLERSWIKYSGSSNQNSVRLLHLETGVVKLMCCQCCCFCIESQFYKLPKLTEKIGCSHFIQEVSVKCVLELLPPNLEFSNLTFEENQRLIAFQSLILSMTRPTNHRQYQSADFSGKKCVHHGSCAVIQLCNCDIIIPI